MRGELRGGECVSGEGSGAGWGEEMTHDSPCGAYNSSQDTHQLFVCD